MPIEGYKKSGHSMLDFIQGAVERERNGTITLEEFTNIRRNGTPDEIAEAVEKMMNMGGYANLE